MIRLKHHFVCLPTSHYSHCTNLDAIGSPPNDGYLQASTRIWHTTHDRQLFKPNIKCACAKGRKNASSAPTRIQRNERIDITPPEDMSDQPTPSTTQQELYRGMDQSTPSSVGDSEEEGACVAVNSQCRNKIATCGKPEDTTRERPPFDRRPSASAIQPRIKYPRARVQPRLVGRDITSRTTDEPDSPSTLKVSGRLLQHSSPTGFSELPHQISSM